MKELQSIPGVGKKIAEELVLIGINRISDLRNQDSEALYEKVCLVKRQKVDRCLLYVFRCAVYYATEPNRDPEKLKWWNWKDIKN